LVSNSRYYFNSYVCIYLFEKHSSSLYYYFGKGKD
jgi:hypothetical protein